MSLLKIIKSEVADMNIDSQLDFMSWNPVYKDFMTKKPGEEHYKLLAYLSKLLSQVNNSPIVADIGTLYGASSLALSTHPSIQVTTYDILNLIPQNGKTIANLPNIKRKIMSGQLDIVNIAKSDMILLDIDPHEGLEEKKFINLLLKHGFKGILIVDDIFLNDAMKDFWNTIPENLTKYDVTDIGHWTGTGIIVFDPNTYDIKIV
jgi:predicted O-methyltransferase YrrM